MTDAELDQHLEAPLRQRGMRVTPQRLLMHRALRRLDRHVTADELQAEVSKQLPNASLPTVYATLELLEDLRLVRRVATEGGAVIFDPRTDEHHHLACRRCGAIVDVDAEVGAEALLEAARSAGFQPDDTQVVVRGLCAECSS
jgi:Fe2+ or Zn2+ uptake regulation protein